MYYMETYMEEGKLLFVEYSRKGRELVEPKFKPYCFIYGEDENGYKDAITGKPVKKVAFNTMKEIQKYRYSIHTWEADLPYERRTMLDLDIKISDVPKCYIDIETDDSIGAPNKDRDPIISIGMIFDDGREVFLHGDEEAMLNEFMELTKDIGMIITYNGGEDVWETRSFDMPYLAHRYGKGKKFAFDYAMRHCAFIDIYQIYKYETSRVGKGIAGGFSLDNVAMQELGHGKYKRHGKVIDLTQEELKQYNMTDVRVLKELDEKFSFSDTKIKLAQLTNLCLCSWRGNKKKYELKPLIMVDNLILKEARKNKLVLPNRDYTEKDEGILGALVLEPKVGIYNGVQNFDVKQMYPNIMIYERISPDKDRILVPNILKELKLIREELKAKYNISKLKEDYLTQYAVKVLANVFYGAFGNPACRIYDRDLAQRITTKGRKILSEIKQICETAGFIVLYGDTDSIFTQVDKNKVDSLQKIINERIYPYELESGEYYDKLLFVGDVSGGAKKRYAGLTDAGEIKTVGMESVRRDYCVLARECQLFAIHKMLGGSTKEQLQQCLRTLQNAMKRRVYDDWLVITKGVKPYEEYKLKTKAGTVTRGLPHIRALKMAKDLGHQESFDISFVYTKKDVEPVFDRTDLEKLEIDYDLYFDRQIMAVIRPIFSALHLDELADKDIMQTSLFEHMSS